LPEITPPADTLTAPSTQCFTSRAISNPHCTIHNEGALSNCVDGENGMKLSYYALTFLIGIVLTVHLAMNGKVGAVLDNPRVGNALFWCIGAVMAVLIGLSGWQAGALKPLRDVNPILLCAGLPSGEDDEHGH